MHTKTKKTIGIVGGIGPEASANLYLRMIRDVQIRHGIEYDGDFPPILIYNAPMQGFDDAGIADAERVRRQVIDACKTLENAGADFLIIACNTVHVFADEITEAISIPLLNMIQTVADEVHRKRCRRVGILCSESTARLRLYGKKYFQDVEVIHPNPDQQETLNATIGAVLRGQNGPADVTRLTGIMSDMVDHGAEGIILGCTEIPLVVRQGETDIPVFDSIDLVVHAATDRSLNAPPS